MNPSNFTDSRRAYVSRCDRPKKEKGKPKKCKYLNNCVIDSPRH